MVVQFVIKSTCNITVLGRHCHDVLQAGEAKLACFSIVVSLVSYTLYGQMLTFAM
jgi:hypothetical protein